MDQSDDFGQSDDGKDRVSDAFAKPTFVHFTVPQKKGVWRGNTRECRVKSCI